MRHTERDAPVVMAARERSVDSKRLRQDFLGRDPKNHRRMEVVEGCGVGMGDPFKSVARRMFANAPVVAACRACTCGMPGAWEMPGAQRQASRRSDADRGRVRFAGGGPATGSLCSVV